MSDDLKSLSEQVPDTHFRVNGSATLGMIGSSAPMRALFESLRRIASSSSPLLVGGEPGTGKDRIAHAVHALSGLAGKPCTTVDCGAAPDKRVGMALLNALQSDGGGTVVLDGVDRLSVDLQARLLRALRRDEPGTLRTGGEHRGVRIISTTDGDLESAVEQGRFREALYYQLNVLSIEVPPLRERGRDVQLLADFFLDKFTTSGSRRRVVGFSAEARLAMQQWSWPGNVRELVKRIKKAIIMCERGPLYSGDLDLDSRAQGRFTMTLDEARDAAELSALLTALAAANGDFAIAAAKLETSRAELYKLMKKHRIDIASPQLLIGSAR
jgi:DNA-binding NtrC family response regulator